MKDLGVLESATELPVHMENIAEQRSGPGLMVLTPQLQTLHMNRQAVELCRELAQGASGASAAAGLPRPVHDLATDIRSMLQIKTEAKDWEQLQVRRLIGDTRRAVLLRGYALGRIDAILDALLAFVEETPPEVDR